MQFFFGRLPDGGWKRSLCSIDRKQVDKMPLTAPKWQAQ
jgi:hypothetical protein